jgi:hypothetical protein
VATADDDYIKVEHGEKLQSEDPPRLDAEMPRRLAGSS